jgi:hypothetical protein
MANEFVAKNGLISQNNTTVSGSLTVTQGITGSSILITGSTGTLFTSNIDTLLLTGSLTVTGSSTLIGNQTVTGSLTVSGSLTTLSNGLTVTGSIAQNASTASFGGVVGIGTTTPAYTLDVNGTTRVQSNMILGGEIFGPSITYFNGPTVNTGTFNLRYASASLPITLASSINTGALTVDGSSNTVAIITGASGVTSFRIVNTKTGGGTWVFENNRNATTGSLEITNSQPNPCITLFPTRNIAINSNTDSGFKLDVSGSGGSGSVRFQSGLTVTGSLLTSGSSITFTPSLVATATSQSYFLITGSVTQPAATAIGSQIYGVNIAPTMIYTSGSQTNTSLKVTPFFSGSATFSGSQNNIVADFGAVGVGTQFSVNDITSGSIYQVNDISGLPIIEALSDWTVNMYNYPTRIFQKTGSAISITGTLTVSSSAATVFTLTGNQLLIPSQSSDSVAITVSGSGTKGGASYVDFIKVTNTSASIANPNKYFRLNGSGDIEILSSNYGTVILSLTNAGVLSTPGGGTSDARKKNTITYITSSAYDIVSQLQPVSFEFNSNPGVTRHGFIAQDVLPIKPELVLGDGDQEGGTYGLDYEGILALTVKSLQEATVRIEQLEQEVQLLKNK